MHKNSQGDRKWCPVTGLPGKFKFYKIQDGGSLHIEIYTFGHKSAIFAHIFTKIVTQAENGVLQPELRSKLAYTVRQKIEDGGTRHLEIR